MIGAIGPGRPATWPPPEHAVRAVRAPGAPPVYVPDSVPAFSRAPDRVFLIHGVDVRGMRDHGRGATEDLAARLRAEGFPEARALHYNSGSWLLNQLAVLRERLFGTFSRRLTDAILADLQARPLAPGQRISLAGYSLGALVAARVAERLAVAGVPVGALVLIEPKNGGAPSALYEVPRAGKVLLVENQPELQLANPLGVPFAFRHVPGRTHYDMIENPDEGMVRDILGFLR